MDRRSYEEQARLEQLRRERERRLQRARQQNRDNPIQRRRRPLKYMLVQIMAFFITMYFMTFLAVMLPLRPSYSDVEKRELTKFPAFSFSSLLDGTFFDGINTWFADTFPLRDWFISGNTALHSLYGFGSESIIGDPVQGDEIPDVPATQPATQETTQAVESQAAQESTTEEPYEDLPTQSLNGILIRGDAAYEYYNFVQSTADQYVSIVNRCASALQGQATVYDMIVPTSMDIMVPQGVRDELNTSDQKKAIAYMYGSMNSAVHTLDVFDTLKAKNKEYIYFRTDHHWTALGAYYAYEVFAQQKGLTPVSLTEDFYKREYTGYLGSFYSDSNKDSRLGNNPDTVEAYEPKDTNKITITDSKGNENDYTIISDVSTWVASSKYNAFIGGDNPYSVIHNDKVTDGSACLVVKESFGNAFVPFLVPHYQDIYIVDYRYFRQVKDTTVVSLVRQLGVQDVLFLNNTSATRNESLMKYLDRCIGG